VDRKTTTTPHSLKNIFSLKRQDEVSTKKNVNFILSDINTFVKHIFTEHN